MTDAGGTFAITQARMSSTRLPGKVLLDLAGEPVLVRVQQRVQRSKHLDGVIIATSTDTGDHPIAALCEARGIRYYRGPLDDVLRRYVGAAQSAGCDTIVRITSDCPLVDPEVIDLCIESFRAGGYDYQSNCTAGPRTFPRGLDVEVFSVSALEQADGEASDLEDREHVTPFIWKNKNGNFKVGPALEASQAYARDYRLTLDYPEDYRLFKRLYAEFYSDGKIVDVPEVLRYLDKHPEVVAINSSRDADHQKRINV